MVAPMQVTLRWLRASIGPACAAAVLVLAGCASTPPKSGPASRSGGSAAESGRDGADAHPPAGLEQVPDAEPRLEPIRLGGPNKPYEVLGRSYVPITEDRSFSERGLASWYGRKFQGRRTSSGEPYDMYAMTAAHPTLPIPSYARVRNPANGRVVIVRINDRGPFHPGRIVDLSYTAALKLDLLRGVAPVELERITFDEIRAGTWRRGTPADATQFASRAAAPTRPARSGIAVPNDTSVAVATPSSSAEAPGAIAYRGESADRVAAAEPSSPPSAVGAAPLADAAHAETDAPRKLADAAPARGFWVQLGAFRQRDGATAFQQRVAGELDWLSPLLAVFNDAALFRLQAGPYPSRDEARGAAESIRAALQLVPVIVERR